MHVMARFLSIIFLTILLAPTADAFQGKKGAASSPPDLMVASNWEIGPVINGRNYSVNMPLNPSPHPEGWYFDFPYPDKAAGHVHYVTFRHGSLSGKSRIIIRYRIEAEPGVVFHPTNYPGMPTILSLHFQRAGDDWSGRGRYETYRWWSTFRVHSPLTPGEHELSVGLDENWTAVQTSSAATAPKAFRDAVRNADRVGFTLGGGDGYGHGVYASGPARFVVTSFQVI